MTGQRRFVGRAPGRLDLMGSIGSYMGGLALAATIAEAAWAAIDLREDNCIVFVNPQAGEAGWQSRVEFPLGGLSSDDNVRELVNASPETRWTANVLGAFFLLKQWFPDRVTRGANVYITSEIPMGRSSGSSSALAAAVLKTAAHAYGIGLAGADLAAACQWIESMIAESACGMADQIAAALGEPGCLIPVICQPCTPKPPARLPDDLELWRVDTGARSSGVEREAARAATFMAYKLICDWEGLAIDEDSQSQIPRFTDHRWRGYLANVPPSLFRSNYEQRLAELVTGAAYLERAHAHVDHFTAVRPETSYRVRACARFAVEENHRAQLFLELARAGAGFETMGELMYQSHLGYTECGLGSEETDLIVSLVCEESAPGLYGAKISGGGAGGLAVVLGRKDAGEALGHVVNRYAEMRGVKPAISRGSSIGADRFGVLALE